MRSAEHCGGCRNDFYNGHNDLGVTRCWSLDDAKLVTKYRLPVTTPMNQKRAYVKVRVLNCYSRTGFVHLSEIPEYAR